MKKNKVLLGVILILIMVFAFATVAGAVTLTEPKASSDTAINATAKKLISTVTEPTVSSIGGEWTIIGLARSDYAVPQSYYDTYYANVVKCLKDTGGVLSTTKYTEYSRVILALTAIGKDVTNVGGYNLLEKLADFNNLKKQGINGPIFALLALDSHNYEIPVVKGVTVQSTRQMMIDYILSKEITAADGTLGGFSLDGRSPDSDMTAMVVQALSKYTSQAKVKAAVDRSLKMLSSMQKPSGGYYSGGIENPESIGQVLVGLTAAKIDPKTDSRFIKGANWIVSALMSYYLTGGGFKHLAEDTEIDLMSTEQAFYASVAYDRYVDGDKSLYDMTDVTIVDNKSQILNQVKESAQRCYLKSLNQ